MITRPAWFRSRLPAVVALAMMSVATAACPRDDITVGGPSPTLNDGGTGNVDADGSKHDGAAPTKTACGTLSEPACVADDRCRWLESGCNRDNPTAPTGCVERDAVGCDPAGAACAAGLRCVVAYVSNCGGPAAAGSAACARCANEVHVCASTSTADAGTTSTLPDSGTPPESSFDCTTLTRDACRRATATCKWLETTCYRDVEFANGCFHLGDLGCINDASCGAGRHCLVGAVSNCPVDPAPGGPASGQCALCASEVHACSPARSTP